LQIIVVNWLVKLLPTGLYNESGVCG